uniref:Aldo/keto reductase n=1 Tax=Phenylobacterium glaciei TaxID=2803784 RepID=A0A974S7T1_9CAUL|nr:aldo/keto reductase [Phenylobacterium glaciei]
MLYRPLGKTGLTVSEIGFGCASWWGQRAFDEGQAIALVHAALDRGDLLRHRGQLFQRRGRAAVGAGAAGRNLEGLVIATKAGTAHNSRRVVRDMSPAAIKASVLRSLANLGLERLPLLQLHGPAILDLTDDLLATLEGLKARGSLRRWASTASIPPSSTMSRVCRSSTS